MPRPLNSHNFVRFCRITGRDIYEWLFGSAGHLYLSARQRRTEHFGAATRILALQDAGRLTEHKRQAL